jgi:lipopolysaccharide export LptBFGC system permease protein LptF
MLGAMRTSLPQSGFYIFPGMGLPSGATRAQQNAAMQAYQQKIQDGPSGILIYHPNGQKALTPGQLMTEFATNIIQGLLAAFLLSLGTGLHGYAARVSFVTLAGIMAGITTNVSYWNWYGFPASYTASYTLTEIVGFLCIGLVAGAIIKHGSAAPMSAKGYSLAPTPSQESS